MLSTAENGDSLYVFDTNGQTWQMTFQTTGSTFGLFANNTGLEHPLEWWQGTGYMELIRSSNGHVEKLTYPGLDVGATAGLLSATATEGDVWLPVYDYSSGAPTFTGSWIAVSNSYRIVEWTLAASLTRGIRSGSIPFTWLLAKVGLTISTEISAAYTVAMMIESLAVSRADSIAQEQLEWPLLININPNGGATWSPR